MNLILQSKGHLGFIANAGVWTSNQDKARTFPNGLSAMLYCYDRRLPNMQILARFNNPQFNFIVPVTDGYGG